MSAGVGLITGVLFLPHSEYTVLQVWDLETDLLVDTERRSGYMGAVLIQWCTLVCTGSLCQQLRMVWPHC